MITRSKCNLHNVKVFRLDIMSLFPNKNLRSGFMKELMITCCIYSVLICVGICRSYSSFLIIQLRRPNSVICLTIDQESWIATFTVLPAIFGSLFSGLLVDHIGRKLVLLIIFLISFIAWMVVGFAVSVRMLYIGMFLNGLVTGMSNSTAIYVAEISSPKNRGFMLSFMLIFFGIGTVSCNLLLYYIGWNVSALVFGLLSVVLFSISVFLPESPTWLFNKGRRETAMLILTGLRDTLEEAKSEIEDLENRRPVYDSNNNSNNDDDNRAKGFNGTIRSVLFSRKQLLTAIVLLIFQQSSGFSTLLAYNASFFEQLNIPIDVSSASIAYVALFCASTFFTPFVNFYCKRRSTLMFGCCLCFFCFVYMIVYELIFYRQSEKPYFWSILICLYLSVVVGANSIIPLPFVLFGELFPGENRGLMIGISFFVGFIFVGIAMKLFLLILYDYGIITILSGYAVSCSACFLFTLFFLPETKGKTLNEIQEQYFNRRTTTTNNNINNINNNNNNNINNNNNNNNNITTACCREVMIDCKL